MSDTVQAALIAATARLAAVGVDGAARDARLLMAAALDLPAAALTPALREPLTAAAARVFAAHVAARAARRPVAQILGRRAFWGRDFEVTADVLDPRPETETLVALSLEGPAPARILDLGTGSGAILVTLLCERPQARGLGTDLSESALAVASRNAARHGAGDRAAFRLSDWIDWTDATEGGPAGPFDLVVSNPPYVPAADVATLAPEVRDWEPHLALTPGPEGLESYGRIARDLGRVLAPGGRALFEIGVGQGPAVAAAFAARGFATRVHPDLDGRDRVVEAADRRAPAPPGFSLVFRGGAPICSEHPDRNA